MTDTRIRLSKRMTELGLCSRREADEFIELGWVRVDGKVVNVLGSRVGPEQVITIEKQGLQAQAERVTILLNKPVGLACDAPPVRKNAAINLIAADTQYAGDADPASLPPFLKKHLTNLVPVGRLDNEASGLMVYSQDGRVAKKLVGEEAEFEQEFLVTVEQSIPDDVLRELSRITMWGDDQLRPFKVTQPSSKQLRFLLRESRPHMLSSLCEHVELTVNSIRRLRIGRIGLSDLPVGQWRFLGPNERF
ncbi:23S rRNA pseudouridine2604 synthase [Andreprevotia lacus DSM 23236]|jgi:23S rRNA pseudouridine2604 synthase|uniref:Dual-specificity RNA pseudouridine synthase RluF n=1 Tax=Andreprevotia lacus DSM 23236 TaxID=1121001 RepID=A0A1W1WYW8_9NEIS|nr:RNA pseudouridine synthase [Andreprevotia lacus]SMC16855.1 23S rRNA pseudouridine2604 synthase [Andreprevotia lacus DSM 23236]